jgi:hypothetical protein
MASGSENGSRLVDRAQPPDGIRRPLAVPVAVEIDAARIEASSIGSPALHTVGIGSRDQHQRYAGKDILPRKLEVSHEFLDQFDRVGLRSRVDSADQHDQMRRSKLRQQIASSTDFP